MNRIFLLEDDLSLINGLSFAFKKCGFESDVARTVEEAHALWIDGKTADAPDCQAYGIQMECY